MTGILNSHGTNPNIFSGQFISLDDMDMFENVDTGDVPGEDPLRSYWLDVEDIPDGMSLIEHEDEGEYYERIYGEDEDDLSDPSEVLDPNFFSLNGEEIDTASLGRERDSAPHPSEAGKHYDKYHRLAQRRGGRYPRIADFRAHKQRGYIGSAMVQHGVCGNVPA